jgi:hypothetical protein
MSADTPANKSGSAARLAGAVLWMLWGAGLLGCTRSTIPIGALDATRAAAGAASEAQPTFVLVPATLDISTERTYAVFDIPADDRLPVRQPAGISGTIVGWLEADERGLHLTGASTRLGTSAWVEVVRPSGGKGWVRAANLTETVAPQVFCADPAVPELMSDFQKAILTRDGDKLRALTYPERGILLRAAWRNPEVLVQESLVSTLFASQTPYDWGNQPESELAIRGVFGEVMYPTLEDVLSHSPTTSCDTLIIGKTIQPVAWPDEYQNLNFYAFFRPTPNPVNALEWRGVAAGIEYVGGKPYLAVLVLLRAEL